MLKFILYKIFVIILVFGIIVQTKAKTVSGELDSLIRIIENQSDNTGKIDNLLLLANKYTNIDKDSAMMFAKQAHALSIQLNYSKGQMDAIYRKGLIQRKRGDYINAYKYFTELLELSEKLQDSNKMARGYLQYGILYRLWGKERSAIYFHQKSLAIFIALNHTTGVLSNYNSIGNIFKNISEYDSAAFYYMRSIKLCQENAGKEKHLATIYHNLGKVYLDLKEFDNARRYLNMALEYATQYEKYEDLAITYTKLGEVATVEMDLDSALYYYELAELVYRQIDDARGIHDLYINNGIVLEKKGLFDLAYHNFTIALAYYKSQDFPEGVIAAWQSMATVHVHQKKYVLALTLLDSCCQLANKAGLRKKRLGVLIQISDIYYESENYKRSNEYLNRYMVLKDSIYRLEKEEIVADLRIQYERELDQAKILVLENENLRKTKQRNIYFFTGLGIIGLSIFVVLYLRLTARKNRTIAEQRIAQLEEEKKLLAARFLVEGQEDERKRIAKELHDGLGVLLSATKMQFSAIKDKSPENKDLIEKATKFLEQASGDVRKISHNMMPGLLTKLGLFEALEDLFEKLTDTKGINALIEINNAKERLPENREIMIYRIVQEMVNNTLKHAEAGKIEMQVDVFPEKLNISYSDDGKGFEAEEKLEQKSLGLQSIQSRIKFLDGSISIESSVEKGTFYAISIPI